MLVNSVLVRRSDDAEIELFDERDSFIASFKNGKWVKALVFSDYELEDFDLIEDEREIERVLAEARAALGCPLKELSDDMTKSA